MKPPASLFTTLDWSALEGEVHPGETGQAVWRTVEIGELRVRRVD